MNNDQVVEHIPLARAIALSVWRTAPARLDSGELIAVAYMGLCLAAERYPEYCKERGFDASQKEGFGAYAKQKIHGYIYDRMRAADFTPRQVRENYKAIREAGFGEGATEAELMERTGLSKKNIRDAQRVPLNYPITFLEAQPFADIEERDGMRPDLAFPAPPDPTDVEQEVWESELALFAIRTYTQLTALQQNILALRYGQEMQLCEIALMLKISGLRCGKEHTIGILAMKESLSAVIGG